MLKMKSLLLTTLFPTLLASELFYQGAVSTSALSESYASVSAGVEDISFQFYNPATTAYYHNCQGIISGAYFFPVDCFTDGVGSNAVGDNLTGDTTQGGVQNHNFVGGLYGIYCLDHNIHLGLSITNPWQTRHSYKDSWIGRYYGTMIDIKSININPSISWSFHDVLALAVGAQFQYLSLDLDRAIDFGLIAFEIDPNEGTPSEQDGKEKLRTHDWDVGWTAGLLYKACWNVRLGLGYRSEVRHHLQGSTHFTYGEVGNYVAEQTHSYHNTCAEIKWATPDLLWAGLYYFCNDEWQFNFTVNRHGWGKVDNLNVIYGDATENKNQLDLKDTFGLSIGGKYTPCCRDWMIRFGLSYEDSPAGMQHPLFYASESIRGAFGWSWDFHPCLRLEIGYSHDFLRTIPIELSTDTEGNQYRGNVQGKIKSNPNHLAIQFVGKY